MQTLLAKYSKGADSASKYNMKAEQFESRQGYGKNKQLQKELKQAMEDIKKINQEIEEKKKAAGHKGSTLSKKGTNKAELHENQDSTQGKDYIIVGNWCMSLDEDWDTNRVDSPLLDQTTRDKLINLGQSLDSKQFTDALGFIDLRLMLKWFAKAISKHVDFSRGYLFLEDMKKSATLRKEGLKFTYNLNKNMKIDMERLKKKANQINQNKEATEEVKTKGNYNVFANFLIGIE